MQAAYGAGRYAEQMANTEFRPIWERVAVSGYAPDHSTPDFNGFSPL